MLNQLKHEILSLLEIRVETLKETLEGDQNRLYLKIVIRIHKLYDVRWI